VIKRVAIYSLPAGTDSSEFWNYLMNIHNPAFLKACGARLKRMVNHRVTKILVGQPKFWGMTETWWESEETMEEAFRGVESFKYADGTLMRGDFISRIKGEPFISIVEENEVA